MKRIGEPRSNKELHDLLGQLTVLDLGGAYLRDSGIVLLCEILEGNSTVQRLDLSRNDLSASCVERLMRSLNKSGVQELDLKMNRLGTAGAISLADDLHSSSLVRINLFLNGIGLKGLARLAVKLRDNVSVGELDLQGNAEVFGPHTEHMEDTVFLRSITTTVLLPTGRISTAAILDDDSAGHTREGLHTSKYSDGRRLEALWKGGTISKGRMHYPNGDTFEIEGGGQDGEPARGYYHTILIAGQRWWRKAVLLLSSSIAMVDFW